MGRTRDPSPAHWCYLSRYFLLEEGGDDDSRDDRDEEAKQLHTFTSGVLGVFGVRRWPPSTFRVHYKAHDCARGVPWR
jgi:hypothetical protein